MKIHLQAMAAETYELDQIVGIGLRRALEFLIKDFAIRQHPTDSEFIKSTRSLSTIINKYCDDVRIKTAAERAAWLGNDHAHYLREWLDRDIVDLKLLIDLAVHWIDSELLTKQYETEMINKRPADKKQFDKQANVVQFPGSPPKDGSA